MKNRLSIVVPTWNRKGLLADCLASLVRQSFQDFETIVVDDGSTDGTSALVAEAYPSVRVVTLRRNRGFCVAANTGIRQATGDLILLLNNDMALAPDCLERLIEAADTSDAAIFAPLVLWRDDTSKIYAAGDRQSASGRPESIGFRSDRDTFRHPEKIFGASACAGLYKREIFDNVGLLDERFGAYFEDSDLNFRARLQGYDAAFVPDAVAYHVGSASIEGKTWWRSLQCYRNHAILVLKDIPAPLVLIHGCAILAERLSQARHAFSSARAEFGAVKAAVLTASAWCGMMRQVPHALVERRRIQKTRKIGLRDLERLLSSRRDP